MRRGRRQYDRHRHTGRSDSPTTRTCALESERERPQAACFVVGFWAASFPNTVHLRPLARLASAASPVRWRAAEAIRVLRCAEADLRGDAGHRSPGRPPPRSRRARRRRRRSGSRPTVSPGPDIRTATSGEQRPSIRYVSDIKAKRRRESRGRAADSALSRVPHANPHRQVVIVRCTHADLPGKVGSAVAQRRHLSTLPAFRGGRDSGRRHRVHLCAADQRARKPGAALGGAGRRADPDDRLGSLAVAAARAIDIGQLPGRSRRHFVTSFQSVRNVDHRVRAAAFGCAAGELDVSRAGAAGRPRPQGRHRGGQRRRPGDLGSRRGAHRGRPFDNRSVATTPPGGRRNGRSPSRDDAVCESSTARRRRTHVSRRRVRLRARPADAFVPRSPSCSSARFCKHRHGRRPLPGDATAGAVQKGVRGGRRRFRRRRDVLLLASKGASAHACRPKRRKN